MLSNIMDIRQNGNDHQHNFNNKYLPSETLRKPDPEVARIVTDQTKSSLNKIVGQKANLLFNRLSDYAHLQES